MSEQKTTIVQQSVEMMQASKTLFFSPIEKMSTEDATSVWSAIDLIVEFMAGRKEGLRQHLFGLLGKTEANDKGHFIVAFKDGSEATKQMRGGKTRKFNATLAKPVLEKKKLLDEGCVRSFDWKGFDWNEDVTDEEKKVIQKFFNVEVTPTAARVAVLVADGKLTEKENDKCTSPPKPATAALIIEKSPFLVQKFNSAIKELESAVETGNSETAEPAVL